MVSVRGIIGTSGQRQIRTGFRPCHPVRLTYHLEHLHCHPERQRRIFSIKMLHFVQHDKRGVQHDRRPLRHHNTAQSNETGISAKKHRYREHITAIVLGETSCTQPTLIIFKRTIHVFPLLIDPFYTGSLIVAHVLHFSPERLPCHGRGSMTTEWSVWHVKSQLV